MRPGGDADAERTGGAADPGRALAPRLGAEDGGTEERTAGQEAGGEKGTAKHGAAPQKAGMTEPEKVSATKAFTSSLW